MDTVFQQIWGDNNSYNRGILKGIAMGRKRKKPVIEVAGSEYQPTKAEMEEEVVIDASPEELLRAVVQEIDLKLIDPKKGNRKVAG